MAAGLPALLAGIGVLVAAAGLFAAEPPVATSELATPRTGEASPGIVIHLATGSVGGTFLPVGHDLARWFENALPEVRVLVDTTAGSVDNLRRLIEGVDDLAIVGASPLHKVVEDRSRIALAREAAEVCVLGTLYNDAEQYVVRSSLVRDHSMLDLYGLLMYPGPHDSGGEIDTRTVLQALKVEPQFVYPLERDKGYAEAAAALVRGEFDACTFSGGVPIVAVTDLFRDHPGEFEILPFTRHQLNKVRHAALDFQQVEIPAGSYPGQNHGINSVGGPNLLVAGAGLPRHLAARLDRAIRAGIAEPGRNLRGPSSHPVLRILSPALWDTGAREHRCLDDSVSHTP